MGGFEQKDAPVVAASIEPQMLSNDRELRRSSPSVTINTLPESQVSCLAETESVQSAMPEIPCPELDHNQYSRSLLLGHYVVSLRIAKGHPVLENEPEASV